MLSTGVSSCFVSYFKLDNSLGHFAFGAGVTVTIVEMSKVGVKVGMVGRGVMDAIAVGVAVGREVAVLVLIGDGVTVAL